MRDATSQGSHDANQNFGKSQGNPQEDVLTIMFTSNIINIMCIHIYIYNYNYS
jgi:hypothetical protein